MASIEIKDNEISAALDQARQTALQIDSLRAANARTILSLETVLNQSLNGPLNAPSHAAQTHERRTEIRSRIEADEELRSFIIARIKTQTYKQVLAEIADHFPASRHTSLSALHRWWHRYGKHSGAAQSAVIS